MNTAVSVINHPTDETLAAFADGRLDTAARNEVIRHMADCADCRDVVLLATEMAEEAAPRRAAAAVVSFPRVLPLVAIAAAIVIVVAVPSIRERVLGSSSMSEVADLARDLEKRQTTARLTVDTSYKDSESTWRGAEESAELSIERVMLDAQIRASEDATPRNLHALGLASLIADKRNEAVDALRRAASTTESPEILNDLAAAYLERGRGGDYQLALETATRALQLERTPAGLWNRALALERLGRNRDAIAAWQEYIELENDPAWDEAARVRIEDIREFL